MKTLYAILSIIIFSTVLIRAQTINIIKETVDIDDSVVIRLNDYVGNIQWQKSIDSITWIDIENATLDTILIIVDTTTYYRASVTVGSCIPFISDIAKVFVLECPFDINNYIGTYDFHDVYYPSEDLASSVTITEDPDVENGILISGLWPLSCVSYPVKARFDLTNLTIVFEEEQRVTDEIWGAGYMIFPSMVFPLNSCSSDLPLDISFSFEIWGGPYANPILLVPSDKED